MPYPPEREALFYATVNEDGLGLPDTEVLAMEVVRHRRDDPSKRFQGYPAFLKMVREGRCAAKVQPVPPQIKNWEYWQSAVTEDSLRDAMVTTEVEVDFRYLPTLPDFLFRGCPLVSERFKDLITEIAPDACDFFPMAIFDKVSGARTELKTWRLLIKHWVFCTLDPDEKPARKADVDFRVVGNGAHWVEMQRNPAVRAWLTEMGVFALSGGTGKPVFAAHIYDQIQAAGMTGLNGQSKFKLYDTSHKEVIGHVWRV